MKNSISYLLILVASVLIFSGCASQNKQGTLNNNQPPRLPGTQVYDEGGILYNYIVAIQDKVMSNWKRTHGRHANLVIATFKVFPEGNIDKPSIKKSSGNSILDGLALHAIEDSEPFPPIPAEYEKPSINILINFKYVGSSQEDLY